MSTAIAPTQSELDELKAQVEAQKRSAEYQQLKQDLEAMTIKNTHATNDDAAMQVSDTHRVLDTNRKTHSVIDKMITRAFHMCSLQPVIGSLIVILLVLAGPAFLSFLAQSAKTHDATLLSKVLPFLLKGSVTMVTIGLAILRSASRSLALPLVGMATSAFFCTSLDASEKILHFHYNDFMILGTASFIALLVSAISVR